MPTRTLIAIEETAAHLGTSVRHVRNLIARREIPYHKVGRLVRFDRADLDAWLDANRVEAVAS